MAIKVPSALQLFPMSHMKDKEFKGWSIERLQRDFFLGRLSTGLTAGRFRYPSRGLEYEADKVVLFQFRRQVVASGVLIGSEKYPEPIDGYRGELHFDPASIKIFRPVGGNVFRKIWPEKFEDFGREKLTLDPRKFPELLAVLTDVESAPVGFTGGFEADLVRVATTRIVRDTAIANHVKELHEYTCQLCGLTVELLNGERYAEGHHIRPRGHGGKDEPNNILCVCPNHHVQCDRGVLRLDMTALRLAVGHPILQEYIDYHNDMIFGRGTPSVDELEGK